MLKKSIVLGVAVLLLLGLLFGRSHVLTTIGMVKQTVKESVPVDFEIDRARKMITDLAPEIRRNMHLIAKEEVEVERLAAQVETAGGQRCEHGQQHQHMQRFIPVPNRPHQFTPPPG